MMILKKNVLYLPTYLCPNVFRHVSPDIAVAQNRIHIKEEEEKNPLTLPAPRSIPPGRFYLTGKNAIFFPVKWQHEIPASPKVELIDWSRF